MALFGCANDEQFLREVNDLVSSKNKIIHIKVSKDVYDFITTFSKKYNVSISSFCQDCVTKAILDHDKKANDSKYSGCSPDVYFRKLAWFINETYDERRK